MEREEIPLPQGKREKLEYFRGLIDVNKPNLTISQCKEGILYKTQIENKEVSLIAPENINLHLKYQFLNLKEAKDTPKDETLNYPSISYACWGGLNDHYRQFAYTDETGTLIIKE